jgi:hypothetical protein
MARSFVDQSMGFAPKTWVRTGFAAGGTGIRTFGPPPPWGPAVNSRAARPPLRYPCPCSLHRRVIQTWFPDQGDAFRWATEGSARCLERDDIGAIAPGKQADMAFYKLDELRFSGAGDPLAALVLCGAHAADRVMIKGEWRVVDGAPLGVDLARLRAQHGKAAERFVE